MKASSLFASGIFLLSLLAMIAPPAVVRAADDPTAELRALEDVAYKSGDDLSEYEKQRCKLDVYLPDSGGDWPVLVWFHGGGLKAGDKQGTPDDGVKPKFMAASLARAGVVVVSVNYRFSPKVKFPAYLEDAAAAVAWTKQKLPAHGADLRRLFVGGHSAGGWIAFMLGLDAQFLGAEGMKLDEVAGFFPVSGQTVTHSTVRGERGIGRHTIVADEAAPLFHIRRNTPPMLVIFGDRDMAGRADENELFVEMMKAAGNPGIRGLRVPDRSHGSIANEIATPGDPARQAMLEFMGVEVAGQDE